MLANGLCWHWPDISGDIPQPDELEHVLNGMAQTSRKDLWPFSTHKCSISTGMKTNGYCTAYSLSAPYKHSTRGPPVGHQRLATTGQQAHFDPLGGTRVGCNVGRRWQAATEPTLLSSCPPLCLLMFHFTGFGSQQLTSSCHSANPSSTGLASSPVLLAG